MKKRLKNIEDNYYRGFPISASEGKAIEVWKKKHDTEVHKFTASRGAEFEFRELG